jgi:AraC-like DNA-binding protein
MAVQEILNRMQISYTSIRLGEVELTESITDDQLAQLSTELTSIGFAMADDRKSRIIEKIKNTIIALVHHAEEPIKVNLSSYITTQLNYDYNYMSHLFSEVQGITIEQYFIAQKIERVKELLVYDELSLSEIAYQLGYSSVAHLSNQFKKVTGLTPTYFKNIRADKRKPLDEV